MAVRTTTIRQDDEQAAMLAAVARVDGVTASEAVRTAIADHIQRRLGDPGFRRRARQQADEDRRMLERMGA